MTPLQPDGRAWGVASPHPAATQAAAAVLSSGGTAVDGAIAAAGVLTVVYPHNCSLGGDLIALVRAAGGTPKVVFGVGRSAAATDVEALRSRFGEHVPPYGPFSISVPGVVSGWQSMHELGGGTALEALLDPARELAAGGVAVSGSLARALEALDSPNLGLAEVFGRPGQRLGIGEVFVQPRLAETLGQVAADPECYYNGALARRLVDALASAGSPITLADFSKHRAVVGEVEVTDAGVLAPRLFTAGLPSQGVFFAAIAKIVGRLLSEGYDLAGRDAAMLARAFHEVSSVRDEVLSDPTRSPGQHEVAARLDRIQLFADGAGNGQAHQVAAQKVRPRGDTVAVVTYDGSGNSVSMLQSVFHSFGSRVLDPGTGVLFHNRQSMFTLRPGAPGELGPGLMPPHTLCPTMSDAADGSPSIVLSSMGGRGQPQVLAQVLLQLTAGRGAADAVSAPRFIVGDTETPHPHAALTAEGGLPAAVTASLVQGGFDVRAVDGLTEDAGHAQLLCIGPGGVVDAGSDPRADGVAAYAR